jgi:hypothetical protein
MARRTRTSWRPVVLVAVSLLGIGATGLGVMFTWQGLERADQLASVIGVFVGLAGLAVAGYSAWLARATLRVAEHAMPAPPPVEGPDTAGRQTQNITARASGSVAQGAMFGNIYNDRSGPGVSPSGATRPDSADDIPHG